MKKNLKPMIISALTAIAMGSIGVGTTFALFTDKAETSISVKAGVVEIANTVEITEAKSLYDTPETVTGGVNATYVNGGTAAVNNATHKVEITKWTPGDEITLRTNPDNNSDVKTLMRLRIVAEGELAPALIIKGKKSTATDYEFAIKGNKNIATGWEAIDFDKNPAAYDLNISFPNTDNEIRDKDDKEGDNKYQEKEASITIYYEAVQGNAHIDDLLDRVNFKLANEEIIDNGANPTMSDAFEDLDGLLTPAKALEKSFVWSQELDQFAYKSSVTSDKYRYFEVYNELPAVADQNFSIFANGWTSVTSVTLNGVGFDAANATGIEAISYGNTTGEAHNVVIRTNSENTSLTVNAASDTVKHYGSVGALNIVAVANQSYHEYGQVAFAEIKTGRIVLESESKVEHIHLNTSEVNSETVFNDITVAKAEDVVMPSFSRDPVEIPEEGKLVVALQDGTDKDDRKDYVWLTNVGIYEQVTVSDSDQEAGQTFAADTDDQEKKDTAQQIANNISVEVGGDTYTVKAEKTSSGWDYVLVDEDKQVSEEYSVSGTPVVTVSTDEETAITTTTVNVSVVDANEDPVTSATSVIENGSDKAEEKNKYVAELLSNDAELRAFLAGTKQKGKLANNISNPTVETKSTRYVYANGRNVELDLAGFTLDGYEICVNDGSTLTLTGNGIVNLDDEEAVVIYNGTLALAGAKITGDPEDSAPLLFANYDDNGDPSNCNLVIADDTANYIETSGDGASGIMVTAWSGDMNLNIVGQEKHNGQLFVAAKTEDAWSAIRPYQGGANSKTIIDGLYIELTTESNSYEVIDGTGDVLIKNVSGSFSGNVTEHCQAGYCSKLNNDTGRYEIKLLTEEDATFRITSKSGAESLIAGSIYQAMALATEESTITVLKDCNITEAAWNAPGAGADYFTIDLNGKTISGNDLSIKRPDPRNSNNVTMPVHVTVTNGTMSNGLMLYTYSYVTVSNVHFTNATSSYATAINVNSNIKTNVYDWAEPGTNSITVSNCTFENKYIKLYGSNEGQKIDLTMTDCTMSKTYNGYDSMIETNYYVYGTISLNRCTLNGSFNNTYTNPINIGSTSSSNGGNMVTLNLHDVEINVTGSQTKPVSIGSSWTVNEEGTNVYTVGGEAKKYDGSAIE